MSKTKIHLRKNQRKKRQYGGENEYPEIKPIGMQNVNISSTPTIEQSKPLSFQRVDNKIKEIRGIFDKRFFLNNVFSEIDKRFTQRDYVPILQKLLKKTVKPGPISGPKTKRIAQSLIDRNIKEDFNFTESADTLKDALEELNATDVDLYKVLSEYNIQQSLKKNPLYFETLNTLRENKGLNKDTIAQFQEILKTSGVPETDNITSKLQKLYDVALQQEVTSAPVSEDTISNTGGDNINNDDSTVNTKSIDTEDTTTENTTSTNKASSFVNEEEKKKGLLAAFMLVYDILAIIGVILIVLYFILTVIDIFIYIGNELKQKQKLIFDPNLFNKDTSEFKTLHYNTNVLSDEPYNIYLEQTIVKQMYRIFGLFMLTFGIQMGSYLAFKVLAILKNQEFTEKIDIPRKNLTIMIVLFLAALILSSTYKSEFLNKLQPELKLSQSNITYLKNYIYNNMTTNIEFLDALTTNDVTEMYRIMNKQTTQYSLMKMIFTLSLYNYFKSNVSENEEEFEEIRKIFTIREIKLQQIDPIKYFYYKQNVFIPNMHVVIRPSIIGSSVFKNNKGKYDEKLENAFKILVNSRILEINRGVLKLLKLPTKKTKLLMYLLLTLFIALIFIAIYAMLYKEQVGIAWQIIYPILQKIWNKITSIFSRG